MIVRPAARIAVHVERLVIEGLSLSAADGIQLQAAMESVLRDLYERNPVGMDGSNHELLASVPAPSIRVAEGQNATELGGHIARSLHRAIKR